MLLTRRQAAHALARHIFAHAATGWEFQFMPGIIIRGRGSGRGWMKNVQGAHKSLPRMGPRIVNPVYKIRIAEWLIRHQVFRKPIILPGSKTSIANNYLHFGRLRSAVKRFRKRNIQTVIRTNTI
ncbi:hypothetical protein CEXT_62081 [Caerostris extrusa]|uniref:Uncharacterized protein n=1 Tax=Caerostris extrusa TaxID=172846 RepID=A0AAV4R6V6_CAEEX|nr:hypothetical protein CEXT_62081 [Caerostris extrusa]